VSLGQLKRLMITRENKASLARGEQKSNAVKTGV
jgi:hypothetical protein